MDIQLIHKFFLWCTIVNYGILLFWFLFFLLARDCIYRLHTRWFNISQQNFDAIHYAGMAIYKIGIFIFCLVPFIAIYIIT